MPRKSYKRRCVWCIRVCLTIAPLFPVGFAADSADYFVRRTRISGFLCVCLFWAFFWCVASFCPPFFALPLFLFFFLALLHSSTTKPTAKYQSREPTLSCVCSEECPRLPMGKKRHAAESLGNGFSYFRISIFPHHGTLSFAFVRRTHTHTRYSYSDVFHKQLS
jgi:hypothetical protein